YSKAVELDESIVGEYRHQELHQPYGAELGMEKERDRWYNALAEIMLREKKPAESLRYLERNSAKRFRDRFFDVPVEIRHTQLQQDVQRTREKLRQLRRLETEWSRWLSVDPQAASEDQLRALQLEIGRSKEEIAQTAERIARIQPNYELLVRVGEITLAGVQSAIPRGTLVLRFLPAPDQFYIFALTRSRFEVRTSAIKADELLRMVDEYQRLMQDPNVYAGAAGVASVPSMTRFATLSTQLYNALLKPIDDLYERNLLIMPGREFETFPFHTIERQDQKGNVQYVVEFMSVDYLPCFAALTYKTAMSLRTKDVIALGNPTGKNWSVDYELRDIRSFYKAATIRIGLEASWQGLTGARGDVLQISSEFGSGRVSKPLGTFVLSGGETQGESVELPFEKLSEVPVFPVVYLSNQLGEGSGLAAAHALLLRIAGTADLFLNSWSADRKAAKFFSEYFYTHLANGLAPGDAYRQTLLNMIRTKEVNHPRSWGQFFHYGTG
ncbi:MAG: CHAT domain-containing protein, partial [Bacteroidota bacterium]